MKLDDKLSIEELISDLKKEGIEVKIEETQSELSNVVDSPSCGGTGCSGSCGSGCGGCSGKRYIDLIED